MKSCCLVWADVPNFYLDMLDEGQKWVRGVVSPTFAASLESSAHRQNIATLSLFCGIII